jgi:hypothetical protein
LRAGKKMAEKKMGARKTKTAVAGAAARSL